MRLRKKALIQIPQRSPRCDNIKNEHQKKFLCEHAIVFEILES